MVGDHKGLLRSLNLYKIFAAYNMVLIHGLSILHPVLVHFGYVENDHIRVSMLRGMFSMTLPAIAGIYFRHLVGPFLENGRLTLSLKSEFPKMIFWVFVIEAIRLLTITGDPGWIYSWQVLHFIALSTLVTYFALRKGTRALILTVILSVAFGAILPPLLRPYIFKMTTVTKDQLEIATLIFSLLTGAIAAIGVRVYRKNSFWLQISMGLILTALTKYFIHPTPENLVSFLNLPVSALVPIQGNLNFWPFLNFYPLFISGYFLRGFFFDLKNMRFFLPLTTFVACLGGFAFYLGVVKSGVDVGVANAISFEVFQRGFAGTIVLISTFYFGWLLSYFLLKGGRFPWIDPWFPRAGSVLTIYVLHTLLFVLLRDYLMKNIEWAKDHGNLLFIYVILHLIYGVSVYLSYTMVKLSHMYAQRKKRASSLPD